MPHIQNTSCFWGVRIILGDLYGWKEPITPDNWRRLDGLIRERADDARGIATSWTRSTSAAPAPKSPAAERRRGRRPLSIRPGMGHSSPAANGANSTRPCMNWSEPGAESPKRPHGHRHRPPSGTSGPFAACGCPRGAGTLCGRIPPPATSFDGHAYLDRHRLLVGHRQ